MGRILINFHNTPNIITRVKTRGPATLTIKEPYVGLAVLLRVASPARGSKIRASREAPSCSSHTVVGALFFWLIGPANLLRLAVHRQRPESSLSRFSWRRCSPLTVSRLLVHISSSPTYFIFAKQGLLRTHIYFTSRAQRKRPKNEGPIRRCCAGGHDDDDGRVPPVLLLHDARPGRADLRVPVRL